MKKTKSATEIIDRIEYIRNYLRLNKSRFSSEIGLKPQTYNNFIGSQGSKPSVELILGVVNRFGASPNWVLNGKGAVFQEWVPEQDRAHPPTEAGSWGVQMAEPAPDGAQPSPRSDIMQRFSSLEDTLRVAERRLDVLEGKRFPMVGEISGMLARLFELDPALAEETSTEFASRLKQTLEERGNNG